MSKFVLSPSAKAVTQILSENPQGLSFPEIKNKLADSVNLPADRLKEKKIRDILSQLQYNKLCTAVNLDQRERCVLMIKFKKNYPAIKKYLLV